MRAEPKVLQLLLHVLIAGNVRKVVILGITPMRSWRVVHSIISWYWSWLQTRKLSESLISSLCYRCCEANSIGKWASSHVNQLLLPLFLNFLLDLIYFLLVYLICTIHVCFDNNLLDVIHLFNYICTSIEASCICDWHSWMITLI